MSGPVPLARRAEEAFRAYRAGDGGRLADLVTLLTPPLWALTRAAGLDHAEAEDVLQGVWVTLVRHADTIDDPAAVFAWLLTTTRRAAWRAARRPPTAPLADGVADPTPGPAEAAETADEGRRLWRHVAALSPRCQALLRVVAYATTPDYAAISAALGMPVGSIGPTRGRCLAALRRALSTDPTWSTA